jgi:hypothetical protein
MNEPCFVEGCERDATLTDEFDTPLCQQCHERREEQAWERFVEDFYGASGPFTLSEQQQRKDGSR